MIDNKKFQSLEYTAKRLGLRPNELDDVRLDQLLQFPDKIVIDDEVCFEADAVNRWKEWRIEEKNY